MIIEVLEQKYKVNCNRGIAKIEKPYLLTELNMIIEWDFCTFPKTLDPDKLEKDEDGNIIPPKETDPRELESLLIENKKFLGDDPELKPGDVFLFRGQVIAVNSETMLVLVV